MSEEKTSMGIRISVEAMERLRSMAQEDTRSPSTQEIEWLIDQEWERRQIGRIAKLGVGSRAEKKDTGGGARATGNIGA